MQLVLFVLNVKVIIYHLSREKDGTVPDASLGVDLT
jgi:hypothetical protein